MRDLLRDFAANLIGLIPDDEYALLLRLCVVERNGKPPVLKVSDQDRILAQGLAARLASVIDYRDDRRELAAVSVRAARLLRAVARMADPSSLSSSSLPSDPLDAIFAAQERKDYPQALALFKDNGGVFFAHFHGMDACLDVLNRFPREFIDKEEMLTLALSMHALKAGNVTHARFLMVRRFGDGMLDLETVIRDRQTYSLAARQFRFLMSVYQDEVISGNLRVLLFDMLAELPIDDHLLRGIFYNAMLAVCLQRHELNEAEDIAWRAHYHYRKAGVHLLVFYIEVHRVVFSLQRGMLGEAERWAARARQALVRVRFEARADWRLLHLLDAVITYEKGAPENLVRFVTEELDKFAYGEIWPVVVELALVYCSRAIGRQVGHGAALSFLKKWRVQEWRSRRFNTAITLREVDILQSANRWQSAAERLTAVSSRINLTWVETAQEGLTRLLDPIEIDLAMAWLRHLIQHMPRRSILREQVEAFLRNEHISERERGRLRLWAAYLARAHRDMTRARHLFSELLEDIARIGIITHFLGDIGLIDTLLDDRRIAAHVLSSADRRAAMRKLHAFTQHPRAQNIPLTRQELRVLFLVAEGATNKFVARQLRLSEATVKFHLTNIFRKMGCQKRTEAVSGARALGWL